MMNLITSRAGTVADSTMVNQVLRQFNDFAQLQKEYQQHDGPVNTLASPYVEYGYADGSANTIRPTSIAPPFSDFYATEFNYSGDDDALDRPTALQFPGAGQQAGYDYFGVASVAGISYGPTSGSPIIGCTLASGSLYPCFDQFGRLIEVPWTKLGDSTNIVDLKYGYNRANSRTYRRDEVAARREPAKIVRRALFVRRHSAARQCRPRPPLFCSLSLDGRGPG